MFPFVYVDCLICFPSVPPSSILLYISRMYMTVIIHTQPTDIFVNIFPDGNLRDNVTV